MLGFWGTIKVALRLPYAKISAAIMILGPIAAFLVALYVPDQKTSSFLLLIIIFTTSIFIDRFGAYIKAVRLEDMKRNGLLSDDKPQKKKSGKKKKKKK